MNIASNFLYSPAHTTNNSSDKLNNSCDWIWFIDCISFWIHKNKERKKKRRHKSPYCRQISCWILNIYVLKCGAQIIAVSYICHQLNHWCVWVLFLSTVTVSEDRMTSLKCVLELTLLHSSYDWSKLIKTLVDTT